MRKVWKWGEGKRGGGVAGYVEEEEEEGGSDSLQPLVGRLKGELSQCVDNSECPGAGPEEDCCGVLLSVWGCSTAGNWFTSGISCDAAAIGSLCETSTEGAAVSESSCVSSSVSLSDISRWLWTGSRVVHGVLVTGAGSVAVGGASHT